MHVFTYVNTMRRKRLVRRPVWLNNAHFLRRNKCHISIFLLIFAPMIKVKLIPYRPELGTIYHRQTKGHGLTSLDGRYKFFIDEKISNPDFLVVHGKGVREELTCNVSPQNTIFLATEPESVLIYPKDYLRQFGHVCTSQERTRATGNQQVHLTPPILPWFIGYKEKGDEVTFSLDYDKLKTMPTPTKTKLISVISSNKAFTQGHIDRLRFVEKLKAHFGNEIDVFGRGSNPFDDKWDVIAPYKYHIVIENSSQRYYWTEKLADCMLAESFPLYYGCTNINEYFPRETYEPIDIRKPEEAIRIIDEQIKSERFELSQPMLKRAKEKVLDEYNLFEFIARLCDTLDAGLPKEKVTIMPCKSSANLKNLWNYTIGRNYYNIKAKLYV